MRVAFSILSLLAVASGCGCSRSKSARETRRIQATAAPVVISTNDAAMSPLASAAPSALPANLAPPVCKVQSKKVWTAGVNPLTGLTEAALPDARVAVGFAIGNKPWVLIVGADAKGVLATVPVPKGTRLATQPKDGTRYLYRVTPVKVEGEAASAFVDYEDKYKDKRRTVVCGPSDTDASWVLFDGIPCAEQKALKPEQQSALFKTEAASSVYSEVQTCRSFTHVATGETWILGSGLHGTKQTDRTIKWASTLFVNAGPPNKDKAIQTTALKAVHANTPDYEVLSSHHLNDGSLLVAARHANHLLVGLLDSDKSVRGEFSNYPGFPTLPDIAQDGEDVVISTSFARGHGEFDLRAFRLSGKDPKLPKRLQEVVVDPGQKDSETDPAFVRDAKGCYWMAHIAGERGKGQLSLSPVNQGFQAVGRSFAVTEANEQASVVRVIPMKDQSIMVVFLRKSEKAMELVTEELQCDVMK